MTENTATEIMAMTIIANAGDGRSLGFQALGKAKDGDYVGAFEILGKADEALKKAHQAQSELLFQEAAGEKHEIGILMIHAQDHLMTGMLANELLKEIVMLYQEKENTK